MSDLAIRVEGLSKRYEIGAAVERLTSLPEAIMRAAKAPFKALANRRQGADANLCLWALKDVNFEIRQGEVVGIIGRNGAGKSTLLKILSRITEPSDGFMEIHGRIASLLEVGTGFHPELSGRENIFLNGAILGMKRRDIERKFDEIVAFAEIERFLDTPVKRYSSGMYTRLAFAVAAHLEPDILLVDEVLAVGDAAFQRKCLGKMGDVARQGRTVLFVSHQMAAVNALCSRCILMQGGQPAYDGESRVAIGRYLDDCGTVSRTALSERKDRQGDGRVRFTGVWLEDPYGNPVDTVCSGQEVRFVADYESADGMPLQILTMAIALKGRLGEPLADLWSESAGFTWENAPPKGRLTCRVPRLPLNTGSYTFNVCGRVNSLLSDWVVDAGSFTVIAGDFFGTGRLPNEEDGTFLIDQQWGIRSSCAELAVSGI